MVPFSLGVVPLPGLKYLAVVAAWLFWVTVAFAGYPPDMESSPPHHSGLGARAATVQLAAADEKKSGEWIEFLFPAADANVSPFSDRAEADRISRPSSDGDIGHATKHFFRYLMEASGADQADTQEIEAGFQRLSTSASHSEFVSGLEELVHEHAGRNPTGSARGLFQVLPEFLTEYASYGGSRFKIKNKEPEAGEVTAETWIESMFSGCAELAVSPGTIDSADISIDPLAGKCVKVNWSGFTRPVALQLFAEGAGNDYGNLHLGEALRTDASGALSCFGHTSRLTKRIALPMNRKCMLRRGAQVVGDGGEIATWTSDFNLRGSGTVYFVVSNVAKHAETSSAPVEFRLIAGALRAAKVGGAHIDPREPTAPGDEVGRGMTLMNSRVHAMTGGPDRIMFDSRSVAGTGVETGFLQGMPGGRSGDPGVFTFVRGGDYWIGWMGDRPGAADIENIGFIMKEPGRLDTMAGAASPSPGAFPSMGTGAIPGLGELGGGMFQAPIVAGGMMGMPGTEECGYQPAVKITLVEQSRHLLRFRVLADLFDPMLMMSAGGSMSGCAALRAMHVESANFEVSLPFGLFYDSNTSIDRGFPEGQEVYDETDFFDGPNFGGILSSRSIFGTGSTDSDETADDPFEPKTIAVRTLTFTGAGPFIPRTIEARTLEFAGRGPYQPKTIQARTLAFTGQGPFEPKTIRASTLTFTGQGPFEPRTILARTLEFTGQGPFEPKTILARTLSFTGQGPFVPKTVLARTLEFEGQGPFDPKTVLARSLTFEGLGGPEPEASALPTPVIVSGEAAPQPTPTTFQPLVPTVEAQVKYLKRLISDQGLSEEIEAMLLDDFATMSDETREYLIKRYRNGYE